MRGGFGDRSHFTEPYGMQWLLLHIVYNTRALDRCVSVRCGYYRKVDSSCIYGCVFVERGGGGIMCHCGLVYMFRGLYRIYLALCRLSNDLIYTEILLLYFFVGNEKIYKKKEFDFSHIFRLHFSHVYKPHMVNPFHETI